MKLLHNVPGFRLEFAEILGQMGITLHLKSREKDGKMEERTDKRGTMGEKRNRKTMNTEVLEMLSRKHRLLLLSRFFCWVCICEYSPV